MTLHAGGRTSLFDELRGTPWELRPGSRMSALGLPSVAPSCTGKASSAVEVGDGERSGSDQVPCPPRLRARHSSSGELPAKSALEPQGSGGTSTPSVDAVSTLGTAFRMDGCIAVLSHDGQGGGLLREVAKLDKREDDSMAILETSYWDVNTDAVMAPACLRARVEVASLVRWILRADSGNGLHGWHAVTRVQAPISGGTGVVDGTNHIPSARERKELQAAVMRGN